MIDGDDETSAMDEITAFLCVGEKKAAAAV